MSDTVTVTKSSPGTLTVIFRDDGPINVGGSPAYRSVSIQLTQEQREQLALRGWKDSWSGSTERYDESIDRAFIEPDEEASK